MGFLEKIQNLPEEKRRIIFWAALIIIGLAVIGLFAKRIQKSADNFNMVDINRDFQVDVLREEMGKIEVPDFKMPDITFPELSEEQMKLLEEELSKATSGDIQ